MSEPAEIITDAAHPGWRALLMYDHDAGQPWGDALAPALLVGPRGHTRFATEVYVPHHAAVIVRAWRHFGDHDLFARYLRQCHGVTTVASVSDRDNTVLIFDTADYRAHTGINGVADLSGDQAEWSAHLDGDVYGVIVEQRQPDPACIHIGHQCGLETVWVHADSCWGFYGHTYALTEAAEMLRACAAA